MSPGSQMRAVTAINAKPKISKIITGKRVERKKDKINLILSLFCTEMILKCFWKTLES